MIANTKGFVDGDPENVGDMQTCYDRNDITKYHCNAITDFMSDHLSCDDAKTIARSADCCNEPGSKEALHFRAFQENLSKNGQAQDKKKKRRLGGTPAPLNKLIRQQDGTYQVTVSPQDGTWEQTGNILTKTIKIGGPTATPTNYPTEYPTAHPSQQVGYKQTKFCKGCWENDCQNLHLR